MRSLHFDQYEFDTNGSEEMLDLVIGTTDQFGDLAAFVRQSGLRLREGPSVSEQPIRALTEVDRWRWVLDYVQRFAGLSLPDSGFAIVLSDEWDDAELVLVTGRYFVWYHWSTTA